MINDLVLRLVVTAVFCVAIAGYSYLLVAQHGRLSGTVNYLLHLVMLIAMVVMAWSARTNIPAAALTVFFLIAGIWFLGVLAALASGIRERLANGYHAVMMAATALMFAVMGGDLLASQSDHSEVHDVHASAMHPLSAMEMSSTDMSSHAIEPAWITAIGWIATLGFAVAALYCLFRLFAERRTSRVPHDASPAQEGLLCQACMAAGMAIMFAVML